MDSHFPWQRQNIAQVEANQQQQPLQQAMPQVTYTPLQLQRIRRQQELLAAEVADLRKPSATMQRSQQQQPQATTEFNDRHPQFYYNNYNGNRAPQTPAQKPALQPRRQPYPYHSAGDSRANSPNAEQFEIIDPTQRNARTFGLISDLFTGLLPSCVNPCTIEAYNQNRCCIVLVNPRPPVCCQYPPRPIPLPPPVPPAPILPPPIFPAPVLPPSPPISCCNTCSYGFYGPPPCVYYDQVGGSGFYGGSGILNNLGNGIGQLLNYLWRPSFFG